jgi:hypothetical protein
VTQDRDFKRVVRARMARTGETYTAARAALEHRAPEVGVTQDPPFDAARREQERLVARLFRDGRLAQIPAKRKKRAGALLGVHPDFAYLRRELVNYRYLERADGRYRVATQAPERTTMQLQEIPAWEAVWLPGFLAGTDV